MPIPRTSVDEPVAIDIRPRPILSFGITGHREISGEYDPILACYNSIVSEISTAFKNIVSREAAYFASEMFRLRAFAMAAEGADLIGLQAARACGAELVCILPFELEEYLHTFSSSEAGILARKIITEANSCFILPGSRAEGPLSYERANGVILANIDLLIAIWDGKRAKGRAGTGDVVQDAIVRGIPVIVIDPQSPGQPTVLTRPDDHELERPIAIDLIRRPAEIHLARLIEQTIAPPPNKVMRESLRDALEERPQPRKYRFEYSAMLALFRVSQANRKLANRRTPIPQNARAKNSGDSLQATSRTIRRFSTLAGYYSNVVRSSSTMEFFIILCLAIVSTSAGLRYQTITSYVIAGQTVLNGIVLLDVQLRNWRRWQERWLDYRSIAEQLHAVQFLHLLGLGVTSQRSVQNERREKSWVDWYVRRWERSLDTPKGRPNVEQAKQGLLEGHIHGQIEYHKDSVRRLGVFERRLSATSKLALAVAAVVAIALGVVYATGGWSTLSWKPWALVVLGFCPVLATALNGIRIDADLIRLVERSALTAAALTRLRLAVASSVMNYDQATFAAEKAAALMTDELAEWRFVLESRRIRNARRFGLGRRRFSRWYSTRTR